MAFDSPKLTLCLSLAIAFVIVIIDHDFIIKSIIDSNGILLRPDSYPLLGAEAVDFISQTSDTSFTIIWQPKGGAVAASGELGYTYGVYSITPKNKDKIIFGTYVNIWKKQADGNWKIVLDSGNEGLDK